MTSGSGTPVPPVYPHIGPDTIDDSLVADLVETLVDGVRGYRAAAERVDREDLAAFMRTQADRRQALVEELVRIAAGEGAAIDVQADFDGTASGALHRAWIAVESAVAGDEAVVESAISGEEHALEQCEEALGDGLGEPIAAAVRSAVAQIRESIDALAQRAA